jgi:hypothetical protein
MFFCNFIGGNMLEELRPDQVDSQFREIENSSDTALVIKEPVIPSLFEQCMQGFRKVDLMNELVECPTEGLSLSEQKNLAIRRQEAIQSQEDFSEIPSHIYYTASIVHYSGKGLEVISHIATKLFYGRE